MTRIRTAERRASFEQGCRQMTASKLERYVLPLNLVVGPTGVTGNIVGRQPAGMDGADASVGLTSRVDAAAATLGAAPADGIAAKDAVPRTSGNHARRKRPRQTFMGYRDPKGVIRTIREHMQLINYQNDSCTIFLHPGYRSP